MCYIIEIMISLNSRSYPITVTFISLVIPLIIGQTGTYYYSHRNLRTLAENNITVPARSKLECAIICKSDENCVTANYGISNENNSICELMSIESQVSGFSTETSGNWHTLGK